MRSQWWNWCKKSNFYVVTNLTSLLNLTKGVGVVVLYYMKTLREKYYDNFGRCRKVYTIETSCYI